MLGFVEYLFGAAAFVPHGYCLLWRPDLVAMHAVSDLLIAAAYFSIPVALFVFQKRRSDLAYPWVFRLFAAFIFLCGATHIVALWTLWQPVYGLQGLVKSVTAAVSLATAIALWPLLPRALALPSPAMLRSANTLLEAEIVQRRASQAALRHAHDQLEQRVQERTRELTEVNRQLALEIEHRRRTEAELKDALSRLRQHMANTPLGVIELKYLDGSLTDGRISQWSGQAPAIFRWTAEEAVGQSIDELGLVHEADQTKRAVVVNDLASRRTPSAVFGIRCYTRQREIRHCRCHASVVHSEDGGPATVLILVEDVTDRVYADERIYRLAHHDLVTGLPNRLLFQDRLNQALARARRDKAKVGLMMLDLDHFKEVNDSMGHAAGDLLLQGVTKRLTAVARETDTLARLGGDEFALIQTGLGDESGAQIMAQRMLDALAAPFAVEGQEMAVSTSIGITIFPDDGETAEQLMRNADMAVYRAKAAGRGTSARYHVAMDREVQASRSLQRRIREALEQDLFELVYQPIVDLESGRQVESEALLRLDHPSGGRIAPAILIPIAEASGLIQPLGEWIIERACRDAARWRKQGEDTRIAVNLSVAQLRHRNLVPAIEQSLRTHGLEPKTLELEITESIFLDPSMNIIADTLGGLAEMGVGLALDDFGTGYSSLSYLKHFPFQTIKLDASFVRDIGNDEGGESIVLAILALGRSLGKRVIAEGIETEAQRAYLRAHGCLLGQGFLLGRPSPPRR